MQPVSLLFALGLGSGTSVLIGYVLNTEGRKLADCNVIARKKNDSSETLSVTDSQGCFRISGMDAGMYEVEISREGFLTERVDSLAMREGATIRINMRLVPDGSKMNESDNDDDDLI